MKWSERYQHQFRAAGAIAMVIEVAILAGIAFTIYRQLDTQQGQLNTQIDQQKHDSLIAPKDSLHSLNRLAMEYPGIFGPVLYPDLTKKEEEKNGEEEEGEKKVDTKEVKIVTAAYASLHALETIYYMRRDEGCPPKEDDFKEFLRQYVKSEEMKKAWNAPSARQAFTTEFQCQLDEVIPLPSLRGVGKRAGR